MDFDNTIIKQLCKQANKSIMDKHLAACILQGKKIISFIKCNTPSNENKKEINNSHAESNAIIKYFENNNNNNKKLNLLVIRIGKNNDFYNARPCIECLKMLKKYNINKIFYSVSDKIICERVRYMISIHVSNHMLLSNNKNCGKSKTIYLNLLSQYSITTIYNMEMFLKYNLVNIFPSYTLDVKDKYVFIMDDNIIVTRITLC